MTVDANDRIITAALHLVADEAVARAAPMSVARHIRSHAVPHVIGLAELAMHEGRASAGATLLPDGRVVFVIEVWPKKSR